MNNRFSPERWPTTLNQFRRFIQSLPYPTAIYWSEQLIFLGNDAWRRDELDGAREGIPQVGQLKQKGKECLQLAMTENKSIYVDPQLLSDHFPQDLQTLISPIPEHDSDIVNGVLVQVLPKLIKMSSLWSANPQITSLEQLDHHPWSNIESEQISASQELMGVNMNPERDSSYTQEQNSLGSKPELIKTGAHFHGLGGISRADTEGYQGSIEDPPLDENPIFKRFATMLPIGLAILNQDAEAIFVNPQFHELTVHEDNDKTFKKWPYTIHQDDHQRVMDAYRTAFKEQTRLRIEFRTRGKGNTWRLLLLSPLKEDTLRLSSLQKYGGFICAIIDITPNKSAEIAERKAAGEARERGERQERFIDMISHEIRNPLSAVLHCAEDILDISNDRSLNIHKDSINALIEAAETIRLCVTHQSSIVDDVLSFSKLDASLLKLSPRAVQPKYQFINTLKMFQPEMRKYSIKYEMNIDYSYDDFHVEWVNADLVRMAQVLINLITNAVKFTARKDGDREITVAVGASEIRPTSYPPNVVFFDTEEKSLNLDNTNNPEWGSSEAIYIMVAVIDTGIGIGDEMQKRLFQRFHQALPRTEQNYGGSGLGLNISRKLCHLHGGEVGMKSKEGHGSTFGFFFRSRRTKLHGVKIWPSDQETIASTELEYQLQHLNQLPDGIVSISEANVPESLRIPISEHVPEVTPKVSKDEKYFHTREIASQVSAKTNQSIEIQNKASKHTVLLVEDNIINSRILRKKLEVKDFAVQCAFNGREAVDAVTIATPPNQAFDFVLMDQEMPVMNGNAASQAIRRWEKEIREKHGLECWHIPILGVSANVREAQKNSMLSAGMDDVIGKPYNIEDLLARMKLMMAKIGTYELKASSS